MNKKLIALLIGLALLCVFGVAGAEIISAKTSWYYGGSDNLTFTLDTSTGVFTVSGSGGWNDYETWMGPPYGSDYIPDTTGALGDYRASIRKVVINEGVTSIAAAAFRGCTNLLNVSLPSTITSIGVEAFSGCSSLQSITLPSGLARIGNLAFKECTALMNCSIPSTVTSIGAEAFSNTSALRQIVTYGDLGDDAFSGSGITSAQVNSCGSLGLYVFNECRSLSSVTLCEGIPSIPKRAFYKCAILNKIIIPASVTSIGQDAFTDCALLTSVTVPSSVISIGVEAFAHTGLTSITLPASVVTLGDGCFYGCESLISATLPSGLVTIPEYIFKDCKSLMTVSIPSSVLIIGGEAFRDCSSLQSVSLPSGVTSIRDYAFTGCKALTSFAVPQNVNSISLQMLSGTGIKAVSIPTTVGTINTDAFYNCSNLRDVFYGGTEAQRNNLSIGNWNDDLTASVWHYGETQLPANLDKIWTIKYTWSQDHSSVTATAVCCQNAAHSVTETVKTDEDIQKSPTCDTEGQATYETKDFTFLYFVKQNTQAVLPALGHDWSKTVYKWADDCLSVTASRECGRDWRHQEEETVKTTFKVLTEPTVSKAGKGQYTTEAFANTDFKVQKKTVTLKAAVNSTFFPDKAFRTYITKNFDTNKDGYLSLAEINAVKEIDLSNVGTVKDLKGIRFFTALKELDVRNNKLVALDLSKNTKLTDLYSDDNVRKVTVKGGKLDVKTMGIDAAKVTKVKGAAYSKGILTAVKPGKITYTYDCGRGFKRTFTIDMAASKVAIKTVTLKKTSLPYTGKAIEPALTVKANVSGSSMTLKEGQYTATYKNNVKAGTATVTVTGTGFFKGTIKKTFTITKVDLYSAKLAYTTADYTGKALKPNVTVKAKVNGKTVTLTKGTDFTVTYKDNIEAGTATVIIKGKGNFKGTITKTFTIE